MYIHSILQLENDKNDTKTKQMLTGGKFDFSC